MSVKISRHEHEIHAEPSAEIKEFKIVCNHSLDIVRAYLYVLTEQGEEVLSYSSLANRVRLDVSIISTKVMFRAIGYQVIDGKEIKVASLDLPATDLELSDSIGFIQLDL